MRVVVFGFDSDEKNPHYPANLEQNCVVYTGTHDNDTVMGWWEAASEPVKALAMRTLAQTDDVCDAMIECAFASKAETAIVPMQDVLHLGNEARMNHPGTVAATGFGACDPARRTRRSQGVCSPLRGKQTASRRPEKEGTTMNVRELIAQTEKNLLREHHLTLEKATPWQLNNALAQACMSAVAPAWVACEWRKDAARRAFYLSAEYLVGRMTTNNLLALGRAGGGARPVL